MSEQVTKPRPIQTRIKHSILSEYLSAWGGIILYGLRSKLTHVKFVFVDTCAGAGRYAGDVGGTTDVVYGSPIIGYESLDKLHKTARANGISLSTQAIVIEEDDDQWNELLKSLELSGLGAQVCFNPTLNTLADRQIACFHGSWVHMVDEILKYVDQPNTFTFWFIDPYGPKALPSVPVCKVVNFKHQDSIIYMPTQNLVRVIGILLKEQRGETLSAAEQGILSNFDTMFGSNSWREIALGYSNDRENDQSLNLELKMIEFYESVLKERDPNLVTKSIPLRWQDIDRTVYHLCLTTHDPTGAIRMNQVLYDAKLDEYDLRAQIREQQREERTRQISLLPSDVPSESARPPRPQTEEIAKHIFDLFRGSETRYRVVLARLANSPYFNNEIKAALRELKKKKLVSWKDEDIRNNTEMIFSD